MAAIKILYGYIAMKSLMTPSKAQITLNNAFMTNTSANSKRIAKNTLLLYVRMLFMMALVSTL